MPQREEGRVVIVVCPCEHGHPANHSVAPGSLMLLALATLVVLARISRKARNVQAETQ